jgi:hypothetical protein
MPDTETPSPETWPRWLSSLVGIWLLISAFAWPHSRPDQTNAGIVGALIAFAAFWALFVPQVRCLVTVLAVWLFFSTFALTHAMHHARDTVWNNVLVAVVTLVLSLVPTARVRWTSAHPLGAL